MLLSTLLLAARLTRLVLLMRDRSFILGRPGVITTSHGLQAVHKNYCSIIKKYHTNNNNPEFFAFNLINNTIVVKNLPILNLLRHRVRTGR